MEKLLVLDALLKRILVEWGRIVRGVSEVVFEERNTNNSREGGEPISSRERKKAF